MATPKKKAFTPDPEAAKNNLKDALDRLKTGLESIATPAGFVRHLTFSARGNLHRYSARNQIIIMITRPGAFHVGGYHYWIKKGRRPLAGQGIRILAPAVFKKVETVDPSDPRGEDAIAVTAEDGTTVYQIERMMRRFKTVTVWDIQDTSDAKGNAYDGPTGGMVSGGTAQVEFLTTDDDDEKSAGIDDALRAYMVAQGVKVIRECDPRAYGTYNARTNVLCVSPKYDPLTTCATVVHEAAHWQEFVQGSREGYNLGELVAEGAAFLVLAHFGLDTSSFSFKYIKSYGGDLKMLQKGLTALQKISTLLVNAIEQGGDESPQGEGE